jgi:Flp pilus assembly protein protease CpaA
MTPLNILLPSSMPLSELFSPINLFLISLAIFWMLISSIQDFKHREVENWWNFSLIILVLAFRAFLSIEHWNYMYFLWGLIGLAVGFLLANLFYYARMFAGGDAKLLMSLGVILPLGTSIQTNLTLLILFLIFFLLAGSLYGLVYSLFLTFTNFKKFTYEFSNQFKKNKRLIILIESSLALVFILFLIFGFYTGLLLLLVLFLAPFLFLYARAVEDSCMEHYVPISKLTIGDWTIHPIKAGKRIIKPNWEGLSENELKLIKRYCKGKVLVKQGIPFVPTFLIAFIVMIIFLKIS